MAIFTAVSITIFNNLLFPKASAAGIAMFASDGTRREAKVFPPLTEKEITAKDGCKELMERVPCSNIFALKKSTICIPVAKPRTPGIS
ncbi:hypothetical protein KL86DPRO_10099 [uncultured delta proteobacterium]|uniref:Uncharacterized protein n=1 Tax=uncultured delta proteobacterium TaxID=34034 RepID=A0A212IUJ1_9DELT|nr:hypothetical protein KL86DPRO_10099 [uncultured delta proteobacterium]